MYTNNVSIPQMYANFLGSSDLAGGFSSLVGGYDSAINSLSGLSMNNGLLNYGYGPGSETQNMTTAQYQKYMKDSTITGMKDQTEITKAQRGEDFKNRVSGDAVNDQIGVLKRKIEENDTAGIASAHKILRNLVKAKIKDETGVDASDTEVDSELKILYTGTAKSNLIDDLQQHGDNSFIKGATEGFFGLGFLTGDKDAADNIAAVNGEQVSAGDQVGRWAGRILGIGGAGLAAFALLKHGGNPFKLIGKAMTSIDDAKIASRLTKTGALSKKLEGLSKTVTTPEMKKSTEEAMQILNTTREGLINTQNARAMKDITKELRQLAKVIR